jgi:hypothetical protein
MARFTSCLGPPCCARDAFSQASPATGSVDDTHHPIEMATMGTACLDYVMTEAEKLDFERDEDVSLKVWIEEHLGK